MSSDEKNPGTIPSEDLRRAMNTLRSSLGSTVVDLLISDLQRHGIIVEGEESYTRNQVTDALKKTFGEDGGELLIDMVIRSLSEK